MMSRWNCRNGVAMKKIRGVTLRSTALSLIYLLNSMAFYIPVAYSAMESFYNYIMVLLLAVAVLSIVRFHCDRNILIISALVMITGFIGIPFNNLPVGDFLTLVWFFLLFYCFSQLPLRELKSPLFHCVNLAFWGYLMAYSVIYYFIFPDKEPIFGIMASPNIVGLGIAQYALLWEITGFDSRKNFQRKKLLIRGLSLIGLYFSHCRAALLFFIVALFAEAVMKDDKFKHLKSARVATTALVLGGVLFPLAYIALWKRLGSDVMFMEKQLFTGRERIWSTLLDYVKSHPKKLFLGTGKIHELFWHNKLNLHNSYFGFFVEHGLIASFVFWLCLLLILFKKYAKIHALKWKSNHLDTDIIAIVVALFTLCVAYTETYYTYLSPLVYIAYAYGVIGRKEKIR